MAMSWLFILTIIQDIYRDMLDAFSGSAFHIGGDEVNFNCWNTTSEITDYMGKKGLAKIELDFKTPTSSALFLNLGTESIQVNTRDSLWTLIF